MADALSMDTLNNIVKWKRKVVDEYGDALPKEKQYKRQISPFLLGLTDNPLD